MSYRRRHKVLEQCKEGGVRAKSKVALQSWMVAIVQRKRLQEPKLLCSGVLINEEWVLTGNNYFACFQPSRHMTSEQRCMDVVLASFQHPYNVVLTLCTGWLGCKCGLQRDTPTQWIGLKEDIYDGLNLEMFLLELFLLQLRVKWNFEYHVTNARELKVKVIDF